MRCPHTIQILTATDTLAHCTEKFQSIHFVSLSRWVSFWSYFSHGPKRFL